MNSFQIDLELNGLPYVPNSLKIEFGSSEVAIFPKNVVWSFCAINTDPLRVEQISSECAGMQKMAAIAQSATAVLLGLRTGASLVTPNTMQELQSNLDAVI